MALSTSTIKQVNLSREDTYRKAKMVVALENRSLLSVDAKKYIESGRRKR